MKKIYIIRHAKSDQNFFGNDFERPLNERGKKDAPLMAGRLKETESRVDAFVSSPARRARKTAEVFAEAYGAKEEELVMVSALYHAPSNVFFEEISRFPDEWNTVLIFSHNPGITHFVNELTNTVRVDNMPTCAIFAVEADISSWQAFEDAEKKFLLFDYPKK